MSPEDGPPNDDPEPEPPRIRRPRQDRDSASGDDAPAISPTGPIPGDAILSRVPHHLHAVYLRLLRDAWRD